MNRTTQPTPARVEITARGQAESRRFRIATAAAAALAASLLFTNSARANPDPSTGGPLVGTWKITTVPPVTFIPSHLAFTTFETGGGLVSSPIIYLPPPFASMGTAHGSWRKTGHREFASTFVAFAYDAASQPAGIVKVNASYRLTGEGMFEGKSQLIVCNLKLECAPPNPGYASISGTLLPVEPLSGP